MTLANSIVAGNTDGSLTGDDCDQCGSQGTYNLISTASTPVTRRRRC